VPDQSLAVGIAHAVMATVVEIVREMRLSRFLKVELATATSASAALAPGLFSLFQLSLEIRSVLRFARLPFVSATKPASPIHGVTSGHLLTLIASARLHRLDPEVYLRDVFRVLPHWPRDRYLELAPRYWWTID
jgi:hypothetical protein